MRKFDEESKVLTLTSEDVLDIRLIASGLKYDEKKVDKDHRFFGKTYSNYSYEGIGFPVKEDDEFISLREANDLFLVKLLKGERSVDVEDAEGNKTTVKKATYQLVGTRSGKGTLVMRQLEAQLDAVSADDYKQTKVGHAQLID